jgi:dipeptidyl aminopeptidase/acylaminoacyl peptidase
VAYTERQISFEQGGQRLYGFLHLPEGPGPHPAVALLHGFGAHHIEAHSLFTKTGRALAASGIGALRFSFRGNGDSEGEFKDVTISGEVEDARAGLGFLGAQPEVDPNRLGLLGLSLGGLVAACAAASEPSVRALALWAPVAHMGELLLATGTAAQTREVESRGYTDIGGLALGAVFVREAMTANPVAALAGYAGPVLVVHGDADETVPPEHGRRYAAELGERAELRIIPGADHVFSSLEWEREVIEGAVDWFGRRLSPS